MSVYELVQSRRSIRRFRREPVPRELLLRCIDAARLAPSAANLQPLRFALANDEETTLRIFEQTKWAGYLPDWNPTAQERPAAFVAVCIDTAVKKAEDFCDIGAAVQNILLTAQEAGLGSCWLLAINKPEISHILNIEEPIRLHSVIGLGIPAERSETEELTDSVKYHYDENGVLHVPKRALDDILL